MSFFVSLGNGPKIFIELAHWASSRRGLHVSRENGEILVWLGRVHVIYTPARWRPPARGPTAAGPLPGGGLPVGGAPGGQDLDGDPPQGFRLAA